MIKNQWYAVLSSKEVKENEIVGVKRLNKDLAFFRDSDGKIHCVMDICAHRGAALSKGECDDGHIKCPFHGIVYKEDGSCTLVPSDGVNSEADYSRFNLKTFYVEERNEFIYLWNGDGEPDKEIDYFAEFSDQSYEYGEIADHWNVHYSRIIENQLDVSHLPFVHHNTIGRGNKTLVNGPKVIWLDDNTLRTSADNEVDEGQKPERPDNAKIKDTNLTFKFPNTWMNTISEKGRVFAAFVPVDEENTMFYLRFYSKFAGVGFLDKFISYLGSKANIVVERQDKRIVETQMPKKSSLKSNENLIQADRPIIAYRKRRQELKDEGNKSTEDNKEKEVN